MPGVEMQRQTRTGDMVKARERIQALFQVLGPFEAYNTLQNSQIPAKDLLNDESVADLISYRLEEPSSGKGNDGVCQWLFDTYQTQDVDLQTVVLRFIPTLCGLYLLRVTSSPDEPLAGFEAVLLALYATETKARGGRPVVINIPNLAQPSLYHTPRNFSRTSAQSHMEIVSPALEPQVSVKSTKRAAIIGVALELFWRRIAVLPLKAKVDLCHYARSWAIQGCSWANEVDIIAKLALPPPLSVTPLKEEDERASPELGISLTIGEAALAVNEQKLGQPQPASSELPGKSLEQDLAGDTAAEETKLNIIAKNFRKIYTKIKTGSTMGNWILNTSEITKDVSLTSSPSSRDNFHEAGEFHYTDFSEGPRVPLEVDTLRPIFKVLGHCLMAPTSPLKVKAAALDAAKALYARSSHNLVPEAILASRSLIRLATAGTVAPFIEPTKPCRPETVVSQV